MNPLEKLVSLHHAILKIEVSLFDNIFTYTTSKLNLLENIFTQSETISKISDTSHNNTDTFMSYFREKFHIVTLLQNISSITDKFKDSHVTKLTSVNTLSDLEQIFSSTSLHSPSNINSNSTLSEKINTTKNSNTTSNHSTNIHIDKVEVNDVSNINDLAFQLQQKVSTL